MMDERVKIVSRMQAVFRNEFWAACSYEKHAYHARRVGRHDIAEQLSLMAVTHRAHMERWGVRIRELGGHPEAGALPDSLLGGVERDDLADALELDLRLEDTEIEEYEILARQSDEETTSLCERCIEDDRRNLRWLREQLQRGGGVDDEGL